MKTIYLALFLIFNSAAIAESKRIEVYATSQAYWDVQPGDSLSSIAYQLIPGPASARQNLMKEIMSLNPQAFINGSPDRLKASIRLWLPNGAQNMKQFSNNDRYRVKNYSWGQIIQRK